MRLGALLFMLLVAASVFSAWMHWRARGAGDRDRAMLRRVFRYLSVWADHWGEDPAKVKEELQKVKAESDSEQLKP